MEITFANVFFFIIIQLLIVVHLQVSLFKQIILLSIGIIALGINLSLKLRGKDKKFTWQETLFVQRRPSWYHVTPLGGAGGRVTSG